MNQRHKVTQGENDSLVNKNKNFCVEGRCGVIRKI